MIEIIAATLEDIQGIMDLHKQNHVNYISEEDKPDGFVTTDFTEQQLHDLITKENGVTIAKDNGVVIAYAMAASWQFWSNWPFFVHMIEKLPENNFNNTQLNDQNSYQYGPITINKKYRNSGLFEKVFYKSLQSMASRYPIMVTFVNKINPRSLNAHTNKVKLNIVGEFTYNNNEYFMLACCTNDYKNFIN